MPSRLSPLAARLAAELERRHAHALYRVRRAIDGPHAATMTVEGRACVNFCSNDYLGLAADPRVAAAASAALARCGTGSGASALISGYNVEHRALEQELAAFVGVERALLFSSGWAANLGVLRGLLRRGDTLIADELNHASLIDGGRLSGARYERVPHRELAAFERALGASTPSPRRTPGSSASPALDPGFRRDDEEARGDGDTVLRLIAIDSVFSMDGALAPLPQLKALCERHDAALMIDDAHGFGVLGANGRGAMEHFDTVPDIYVATLGKSLGCAGAFVAGSEALIEYLIQCARSWIYSTAPPPAIAAGARTALRIVQNEPERRVRLHESIARFRGGARQLGIALPDSITPIQPLLLGDETRALEVSRRLLERGFWVAAIRPPTVPRGTARLRITLSAAHSEAQIDGLLEALKKSVRSVG